MSFYHGRKHFLPPKWLKYNVKHLCLIAEQEDTFRNTSIILSRLKSCTSLRDLRMGKLIHDEAVQTGLDSSIYVSNSLINLYGKTRSMSEAQKVFDKMKEHDVISWNSLILGYAENGEEERAFTLFSSMEARGYVPNTRTFVAVLKACASMATKEETKLVDDKLMRLDTLEKGRRIHSQAVKRGLASNTYVENALVNMYAKCGSLVDARRVYRSMPVHDVVSWTSLIVGYVENGEEELALETFESMKPKGCEPDHLAFIAALSACGSLAMKEPGEELHNTLVKTSMLGKTMEIHSQVARYGHLSEILVANTLVDTYAKCGSLLDSRKIFDTMVKHSVISWTVLMLGYVANEEPEVALELFEFMTTVPDVLSYVAVINACTSFASKDDNNRAKALEMGMGIHIQAKAAGYDTNIYMGSALVDMYVKCGSLSDARDTFNKMEHHDTVSWNSLIMGSAESDTPELGLELLCSMKQQGCWPDTTTYIGVLKACGVIAIPDVTKYVHFEVVRCCHVDDYTALADRLVDVYAKCGRLVDAQAVFDQLSVTDSVTWTALLAGYSRQGDINRVLELFEQMQEQGVEADGVTFICLLTACSHAGLVERGTKYFQAMESEYGIIPTVEHYHCMIDLLGRANRLEEAVSFVDGMPFEATAVTWTVLLAACQKWNNAVIGKRAFESLTKLDHRDAAGYLLMANIYRNSDKLALWDQVEIPENIL